MPTIDELRGTKEGTTQKSSSVSTVLKEAAVFLGMTTATAAPASATPADKHSPDNDQHKIEVAVESKAQEKDESTYYVPAEKNKTPSSEEVIAVSYKDGLYNVTGADGKTITFSEEELANAPVRKENLEHWKKFSKPTQYKDVKLENVEDLAQTPHLAAFDTRNNQILTFTTNVAPEEIQEMLADAVQKGEDLAEIGNAYHRVVALEQVQNDPDVRQSLVEHEKTHRDDAAAGALKKAQVTAEQACKLDMGTEINATLTQIKMGYDKYKQSGNLDDIQGYHAGDLKDFKEWMAQNPHMPEQEIEKQLVKSAYEGWLNTHNQIGTPYYEQAAANSGMSSENASAQKSAAAKFENDANTEQFHKQWDKIFKHTAFGDVRGIVNADFELGKGAQAENLSANTTQENMAAQFLNKIVEGVKNVKQGTRKLKKFFTDVKKTDKDNLRTPEEEEKLRQTFRTVQQKRGVSKFVQKEKKTPSTVSERTTSNTIQKALRQRTRGARSL